MLGVALSIFSFILAFVPFIGPILGGLLFLAYYAGAFVLWIMGLISAANGQTKPVPVVGAKIQEIFKGAFA